MKKSNEQKDSHKKATLTARPSYPGEEIKETCIHAPLDHAFLWVIWKNCHTTPADRLTGKQLSDRDQEALVESKLDVADSLLSCIRKNTGQ